MLKLGVNGFGRIGRMALRCAIDRGLDVVAVNALGSLEESAHLLKYDSAHGVWEQEVSVSDKALVVGGQVIPVLSERDPQNIDWSAYGVNVVLECTGVFKTHEACAPHFNNGAKKVIVSAPSNDVDETFVMGVNHTVYDPEKHHLVSNASCTTNCLAPLVKVLHKRLGIESGLMTTVHAYTADQSLVDRGHKDLRRARAAAQSIVPTSTGAAQAVGKVLPELEGKLTGVALRVPVINVSLVDFVFNSQKSTSISEVNQLLQEASQGELKGILGCESRPLVSCDFMGSAYSSVVDISLTRVLSDKMVKVFSWYDNEMGFTQRMLDMAVYMDKVEAL